jgi:hypothetical protein
LYNISVCKGFQWVQFVATDATGISRVGMQRGE